MTAATLEADLAMLVAQASEGVITAADALAERESLGLLGLTSLGFLRLIHAVERGYGVVLDLDDDVSFMDTVASLAAHLREQGI
ncbi:phosphopantetheine-binding protein [Catellatospora paridis]|uniref:phosphopantetheine-binding protein n=1 Tax=Catellatospora paridis TaxID=1617086 RepID=UPI0012D436BB|nr:phosphopantetheine-binding protein [Catellatospora paridis]